MCLHGLCQRQSYTKSIVQRETGASKAKPLEVSDTRLERRCELIATSANLSIVQLNYSQTLKVSFSERLALSRSSKLHSRCQMCVSPDARTHAIALYIGVLLGVQVSASLSFLFARNSASLASEPLQLCAFKPLRPCAFAPLLLSSLRSSSLCFALSLSALLLYLFSALLVWSLPLLCRRRHFVSATPCRARLLTIY